MVSFIYLNILICWVVSITLWHMGYSMTDNTKQMLFTVVDLLLNDVALFSPESKIL